MAQISVTPLPLLQILKEIKSGTRSHFREGILYGLPADPYDKQSLIEITHSFPTSNFRLGQYDQTPVEKDDQKAALNRAKKTHLDLVKEINYDTVEVGKFTSRHNENKIAFEDIRSLFYSQQKNPNYFYLVVVPSASAVNIHAYRVVHDSKFC